jgi:hypothetical protein
VAVDPRFQDLQLIEIALWFDEKLAAPKAVHDVGELIGLGEYKIHPLGIRLLHGFDRDSQNGNSRRQSEVGCAKEKIGVIVHGHGGLYFFMPTFVRARD